MDNFAVIYKVLDFFEKNMDNESIDMDEISYEKLGITENIWINIMKMMEDNEYIEGITIRKSIDGIISIGCCNPAITLKGLEYLKENSTMKKMYKFFKEVKEITPGF